VRKKRRRRNPNSNADSALTFGGIGGVASAVLGQPQLAGALFLGSGAYALVKGQRNEKLIGGLFGLIGLGALLVRRG